MGQCVYVYCHKNTCLKLHVHDLLYKELKPSAAVNIYEPGSNTARNGKTFQMM